MNPLRIGTRGSQLALYQAHSVAALLHERAGVEAEIVVIKTSGDRLAEAPLSQIGGKRLFVKEIEDALLDGRVDVAVHSSKDMPVVLPEGLWIGAVLPRDDPHDAIVLPAPGPACASLEAVVAHLGQSPRIGTSSVRRIAQLTRLFPGARFQPIRGNLDTRLRKVDAGEFDAIVLAAAGLRRLQHGDRISVGLPAAACIPAPGQGIIAVEHRREDSQVRAWLALIDDRRSASALSAERAVVRRLGGGCQMPIGAYAEPEGEALRLMAVVMSLDGSRAVRAERRGPAEGAEALGHAVAAELIEQGSDEILAEIERAQGAVEGLQP